MAKTKSERKLARVGFATRLTKRDEWIKFCLENGLTLTGFFEVAGDLLMLKVRAGELALTERHSLATGRPLRPPAPRKGRRASK